MKSLSPLIALGVLLATGITSLSAQSSTAKGPVMREPFTLHLKVDKDHYSDIHYDREPYVSENEVYLFPGDKFGVNLIVKGDRVVEVRYQPDKAKADLWFGFEQPKELQNGVFMTLTIDNKMKHGVGMEGLGSIPGKKNPIKTSIQAVEAGKSGTEVWPHPIAQLVLGNLQLLPNNADQSKK
jgi:hypothetical protein